jgi:Domain of unknown function (DUF4169)
MGDIVNLRMARKQAKRDRDERRAEQNRLTHGRPKAERRLTDARNDKAQRDLDRHRIGTGDAP